MCFQGIKIESKQQMYAFENQRTGFEARVFGKEMHRRNKDLKGTTCKDSLR